MSFGALNSAIRSVCSSAPDVGSICALARSASLRKAGSLTSVSNAAAQRREPVGRDRRRRNQRAAERRAGRHEFDDALGGRDPRPPPASAEDRAARGCAAARSGSRAPWCPWRSRSVCEVRHCSQALDTMSSSPRMQREHIVGRARIAADDLELEAAQILHQRRGLIGLRGLAGAADARRASCASRRSSWPARSRRRIITAPTPENVPI